MTNASRKAPLLSIAALILTLVSISAATPSPARAAEKNVFVGAVVASVNGAPITLLDVCRRLHPQRKLTLKEAAQDAEARQVLDAIIMERVVAAEAEAKKISVSPDEVSQYLQEIATRNSLTVDDLGKALAKENRSIDDYKKQVENDILKSKLATSFVKGGVGVSKKEIEEYLDQHPELSRSGAKVKIRQIFISSEGRGQDAARQLIEEVLKKAEGGDNFAMLAAQYSESPEGKEGGLLDLVSENDMHPKVFDALFSLNEGDVSQVTEMDRGFHLFKLEDRIAGELDGGDEREKELEAEAERAIREQKMQERMASYFTTEIFKLHSVDKKI